MTHHPKYPYVSYSPLDTEAEQHFRDCSIIVIGDNHCWGKGDTLNEAKKYANNPKKWLAFIAHNSTTVSEFDGSLSWEKGFAPRLIATQGIKIEEAKV